MTLSAIRFSMDLQQSMECAENVAVGESIEIVWSCVFVVYALKMYYVSVW